MPVAIEIRDLRIDYGNFTAVHNLSLDIARGEIYGLVGPNGAGKTSTLNVLATLLVPTHGRIRMAGFELDTEPGQIRARLGYMPDLAPVINNLKVWEFLDLFAASYGLRGSAKSNRVEACLDLVRLRDKRNHYCSTLSRGMSQRIVLAKTLLHRPEILLLDEPASGMDPLARMEMKEALQNLASTGSTVIISSHILSELAELSTSIGILHKGRLREHGEVNEVLASLKQVTSKIQIAVLGDRDPCRDWLTSRNLAVTRPEKRPQILEVEMTGDEQTHATLLRDLVQAGFSIQGFQARRSSLEDLLRAISVEPEEEHQA